MLPEMQVEIETNPQNVPESTAEAASDSNAPIGPGAPVVPDTWFLSFAQQAVDRMLQRYGIYSSTSTEPEEEHQRLLASSTAEHAGVTPVLKLNLAA
jgi:hypothetical protein